MYSAARKKSGQQIIKLQLICNQITIRRAELSQTERNVFKIYGNAARKASG